jgi:MFS family permease
MPMWPPALRPGPLWRNHDFIRLWSGQTISEFGDQVTNLALPFAAIVVLKASTFEFAALRIVQMLPFSVLSLPAGVWVDRLRRRPILIGADCGRAIALGSIPVAYAADALTLEQLYVVALVAGTLQVFFDVAYQSYLPSLIERDDLSDGNSKLATTQSAAQVAGPGLAGVLIGALKAPFAIAVDAASFLASALFVARIDRLEIAPESARRRGMRSEIAEGVRYVVRHPLMRPGLIWVATSNFFNSVLGAVLLIFAVRGLHLTAASVGLIYSLGNIGVLAGAMLAPRIGRALGVGRALIVFSALGGAAWFFVPTAGAGTAIPFLVAAQVLFGFCAVAANVVGISIYQAMTPDRMLGRMNASRRFVVWGIMPFGALLGGALGSGIGLRATLWIAAVGSAVAFFPMLLSPWRRVRTHADGEDLSRAINDEFLATALGTPA